MKSFSNLSEKMNNTCILIACIHWAISFFTDRLIFQYVTWDFSNLTGIAKTIITYGCKVVFLFLLIGLWQVVFWFVKKADRSFVRFALIYFGINLVLLLLVWPGIWRMDEFGILNSALKLQPLFWQNYLTSLFYVFSLMLFPFPSGVILMQILVNALVVGYILWQVQKRFFTRTSPQWIIYLGFLPFLFLPVLDSNLYPMRMSVYAFLELLLLFKLYLLKKQGSDSTEISTMELVRLGILGGVVTVWRTEAIYYLAAVPVLIVVLFWKEWTKKKKLNAVLIYIICAIVLLTPQQLGNKLLDGNEYDLTSVVLPLVPLVEEASEHTDSTELLADIDRVINVEVTLKGAQEGRSGISLYWGESAFKRTGYTDKDYSAFKGAYYKLILKYPATFLKERWNSFVCSTGLLENTTELFTAQGVPNYETFQTYPMTSAWNDSIRTCVIEMLEWRSPQDYETVQRGYALVYSAIPSICILVLTVLWLCGKRKWSLALLLTASLCKVPLIFLTAPSRLFMYYYSVYLIGYAVLFFLLLQLMSRKERHE